MIFLLTFHDIYSSLECEKIFKREKIKCSIDNVPTHLGLSCGYAVRCEISDAMVIDKTLKENNIIYSKKIAINEHEFDRSKSTAWGIMRNGRYISGL